MANCLTLVSTDSDEYADVVPSDSALTYPFTVAAWCYAASLHTSTFWSWARSNVGSNFNGLSFFDDSGTLRLRGFIYNGSALSDIGTGSLSTATWYRAVWVGVSATERYLYVNKAKDSFTTSKALYTNTANPRKSIGRAGDSTPSGYLNGRVCDVEVYTKAWSDGDVDWDYDNNSDDWIWNRAGTSIVEGDLLNAWLCDEGSGTNLADSAATGNDMTITAAATVAWDNTQSVFEGKAASGGYTNQLSLSGVG